MDFDLLHLSIVQYDLPDEAPLTGVSWILSRIKVQPPDFEWVFRLAPICQENPGLKSETWATHSAFVRASFIALDGSRDRIALLDHVADNLVASA
jgi:hypothetical protein